VKRLEILGVGDTCRRQKELLDQIHEKSGRDLFVANYSAAQNMESPEYFSFVVWGEGANSLLPKVDTVVFGFAGQTGVPKDFVRIDWGMLNQLLAI
jgi:hypothetical protein